MQALSEMDLDLIDMAQKAIQLNLHDANQSKTVGAAVRCKNGEVYAGVNMNPENGTCAEELAIGTAVAAGNTSFSEIVAVRGKDGAEIVMLSVKGCRFLCDCMPDGEVIVPIEKECKKIAVKDLPLFVDKAADKNKHRTHYDVPVCDTSG